MSNSPVQMFLTCSYFMASWSHNNLDPSPAQVHNLWTTLRSHCNFFFSASLPIIREKPKVALCFVTDYCHLLRETTKNVPLIPFTKAITRNNEYSQQSNHSPVIKIILKKSTRRRIIHRQAV